MEQNAPKYVVYLVGKKSIFPTKDSLICADKDGLNNLVKITAPFGDHSECHPLFTAKNLAEKLVSRWNDYTKAWYYLH